MYAHIFKDSAASTKAWLTRDRNAHDFSKAVKSEMVAKEQLVAATPWNFARILSGDRAALLMNSETLPSAAGQLVRAYEQTHDQALLEKARDKIRKYVKSEAVMTLDGPEDLPMVGSFAGMSKSPSDEDIDAALKSHNAAMDSAVSSSLIPEDMTLYRGVGKHSSMFSAGDDHLGKEVKIDELVMTSVKISTAASFAETNDAGERVLIGIDSKAGQKGLYTTGVSSHISDESEVILPAGETYTVAHVERFKDKKGQAFKVVHVSRNAPVDTSPDFVKMTEEKKAVAAKREEYRQQEAIRVRKETTRSALISTLNTKEVMNYDKFGNPSGLNTQWQHPETKEWGHISDPIFVSAIEAFNKKHPNGVTQVGDWSSKEGIVYLDEHGKPIGKGTKTPYKSAAKADTLQGSKLYGYQLVQLMSFLGMPMEAILLWFTENPTTQERASILKTSAGQKVEGFAQVLKNSEASINAWKTRMYRGHGDDSSTSGDLTWFTPDENLAKGYADKRTNGRVSAINVTTKRPFDVGHDNRELTPSQFAVQAMLKAKEFNGMSDKDMLALRSEFMEGQSTKSGKVSDLWADDAGKKRVSKLLNSLGFDSIHLLEDDKPTYGLLNSVQKGSSLLSVIKKALVTSMVPVTDRLSTTRIKRRMRWKD